MRYRSPCLLSTFQARTRSGRPPATCYQLPAARYLQLLCRSRAGIHLPAHQTGLGHPLAKGKKLGRPKGSHDKYGILDPYPDTIREHLQMRVPLRRMWQIVNPQLASPISYNAYRYFVRQDRELLALWEIHRG